MLKVKKNAAGKYFVLSMLVHVILFLLLAFSGLLGPFVKTVKNPPTDISIYQDVGDVSSSQGKLPQIDLPQNGTTAERGAMENKTVAADFTEPTTAMSDGSGMRSEPVNNGGKAGSAGGGGTASAEAGSGNGDTQSSGQAALPARLLTRIAAVYPENLRRQKIAGRVTIGATIGVDGNIEEAHIVNSSGVEEFDQAALAAFDQSTFSPAKNKQGQGVRWYFTKSYNFSLAD